MDFATGGSMMNLENYIASIPDYPQKGVIFRDISPLMGDGAAYQEATRQIVAYAKERGAEMVVGPEARGFIIGCPVAYELGIGFAPARKKVNYLEKQSKLIMV